MRRLPASLPALLAACLLAGCASVSVRPGAESVPAPGTPAQPPRAVVVAPFSFDGADVRADRTGDELDAFRKKVADDLSRDLIASIGALPFPAEAADPNPAPGPRPAWLVRGRFVRVLQGSRALRSFVGFGAGRTTVETAVEVDDLSVPGAPPVLVFQTTGGSGAEPGAVVSVNPVGAALGAGGKAISTGLSADTKRTARMIADYVSEALAARGCLAPDKARKPKLVPAPAPAAPAGS